MNKKLLTSMFSTILCLNILTINVLAAGGTLDGGTANNGNSGTKNPSSGGSSGKPSKPNYDEESSPDVGSKSNPYVSYRYTTYDGGLRASFDNFAGEGTDGSNMVFRNPTQDSFLIEEPGDNGSTWTKWYYPTVRFTKNWDYKNEERSRVTDYYTWTCSGNESWSSREGQYKTVIFNKVGTYTITSVPHQIVKTEKWKTATSKAYDSFSDGTTKLIKSYFWESPHEHLTNLIDRTDLQRTWVFEITPDEVGKPIVLPPKDGTPSGKELTPNDVNWDTQLIR